MPDTTERDTWVARVLGIDVQTLTARNIPEPGGDGAPPSDEAYDDVLQRVAGSALSIWQTANDEVDGQLSRLYDALRITGIPALSEIADEIEGTLTSLRVRLPKALIEYDRASAPDKPKRRDSVLATIESYQTILNTDHRVAAADDNPFGVAVTVAKTLGAALGDLRAALQARNTA